MKAVRVAGVLVLLLLLGTVHSAKRDVDTGVANLRKTRQSSCANVPIPILSKSRLCRCISRPDWQDPSTTEFDPLPQNIYTLKQLPIDIANFGPALFPNHANTICVYFGHAGSAVPNFYSTEEFVMQAINEYGWPTGRWSVNQFKSVCSPNPTPLARVRISNVSLYQERDCYDGDLHWGYEEGWYTESAPGSVSNQTNQTQTQTGLPSLLHFFNPLVEKFGVTALLHLDVTNVTTRPKKIRFAVEALFYRTPTMNSTQFRKAMIRMESATYDLTYNPDDTISVATSSVDIPINLDYSYQVRTKYVAAPNDTCLEVPPPPPPIPTSNESSCICLLREREPRLQAIADQSVLPPIHPRLNLTHYAEYEDPLLIPKEIWDFVAQYEPSRIYVPNLNANGSNEHYLVFLYTFMPVYENRTWREREVVITDWQYFTGRPEGRFLDPFEPADEQNYIDACDEAVQNANVPTRKWTRPPHPAVGKCHPPDNRNPVDTPCYFHFHSDYFFTECVHNCNEPKFICAVWVYGDTIPAAQQKPFEFQFFSSSVYYNNKENAHGTYQLPAGSSSCNLLGSSTIKEWNLLETHLFNEAYVKRSDVWLYNPVATPHFSFVSRSNINSLTIADPSYLDQVLNMTDCLEASTYFTETKDNNLCLCTFWGDNLITWQTHYGRTSSCTYGSLTKEFHEHFKIEFHSRLKDSVRVRVYADLTGANHNILKDYFVLHAIYIQGMDQMGYPVGHFQQGHWNDPTNLADPRCPSNQFPANNQVSDRYPIFSTKDCPQNRADGTYQGSNIFVYQNRWKDEFPIVCGLFQFKHTEFPKSEMVQFLALLRIEDKFDDGHAYMVEVRSEWVHANDLSLPPVKYYPKGRNEDDLTYPPLNYNYYRKSLVATKQHWERACLDPVKDPERLFTTCRHYITTPVVKPAEDRIDNDARIDQYNHLCGQWIQANQRFGTSHPYTAKLEQELMKAITPRNAAIKLKKCFALNAYRTRRKNAWHVKFRVNVTDPDCLYFKSPYLKEAALVAYNEEGFYTGRPGGDIESGGSFSLYNHFGTQGKHEHCIDDDIQLTLDDEIDEANMAFHSEKAKCLYLDSLAIPAYQVDAKLFHQDFGIPSINYVPSLMIWANFKRLFDGFCAIWYFPRITQNGVTPPKYIQFTMEVQIQQKGVSPSVPGGKILIITVRSPKYKFTYDANNVANKLPNGKPNNDADATDPMNLDASVTDSCHLDELPIEPDKRPDDECVCELRPQVANGTGPPPGQKPLCVLKYEFYNHLFDNRLYRTCLIQERRQHSDEDFQDGDCRTKLEYPRPPEVFPNEQISLENTDEDEFNNTVFLEPFDPTDEVYYGCGLVKKCISRFSDDTVEAECIRTKSCGMIVTFGKGLGEAHDSRSEVTIEIMAVARGWAAIGISPKDEKMGEDYVMECAKEGGEVNLYNSWNVKVGQAYKLNHTNFRMRGQWGVKKPKQVIIRPVKTVFYQDKLYCKFYIKKEFTIQDPDLKQSHEYDLDVLYHYVMAFSHALTDPYGEDEGNVRTHKLNGGTSEVGKPKVAAGERLSPLPHETRKFRMHALFMIFAWMFFLTLSIFVPRYFKETLVNTKIFKFDFWYFVHVATGLLALLSLAIGVIFQLSAKSGWRSLFRSNFHTYSGIVAFCLFVAEVVMGLVMKRTLQEKRPLINWVHSAMGHFAYNLAIFNMAFADRVAYGFLACNFRTYCFIWLAVYYVLHAFMSYHYCWVDYIVGRSVIGRRTPTVFDVLTQSLHLHIDGNPDSNRYSLRKSRRLADLEAQRTGGVQRNKFKVKEAPGKYIRVTALVVFALITCAYTFWATRKILTYPKLCYDFYELKKLEEHGFN